jgi:hypothetical protein
LLSLKDALVVERGRNDQDQEQDSKNLHEPQLASRTRTSDHL